MRVVFLSDLEYVGGAAIAASRLARGLAPLGVEVTRLFNNSDSRRAPSAEPVTWASRYVGPPRGLEIGLNAVRRANTRLSRSIAHAYSARALLRALRGLSFDVLHVHALHNCSWDHDTLGELDESLPVVWTFHDYWGFSPESYRFHLADGTEVRLKPDGSDRDRAMQRRLRYFRSRRRLRLAAPARETARRATEHLGLDVEVIPYGMPLDLFAPIDKASARQALRVPPDRFVIGFIADYRNDPVKGFDILRSALTGLTAPRVEAVALGGGPTGTETFGSVPVRMFGHVTNPELLAIFYSAADVFVVPSRAENLALVCLESIACGTPVVGSDVGGIPDMVENGQTGWLFTAGDSDALRSRLDALARAPEIARGLATTCRQRATRDWPLEKQAARYEQIYNALVS